MSNRGTRLTIAAAIVAALALALAGPAAARVVRLAHGRAAGVQLRQVTKTASTPADNGTLSPGGGPVLHAVVPYLVFWDPANQISAASRQVIERYLTDLSADTGQTDDILGVIRQYYDSSGYADQSLTFSASQMIDDTNSFPAQDPTNCPTASGYTSCVSDAQLQSELTNLIQAHGLPTGIGSAAPDYLVITPRSTDVCLSSTSCAAASSQSPLCGYHGHFADSQASSAEVVYAAVPFGSLQPTPKGCQSDNTTPVQEPNSDPAGSDVIVDNVGHELTESITDPLLNAWYDSTSGQEVADNCESYGATANPAMGTSPNAYAPILGGSSSSGTLYDQVINGDHYYTQTDWSNGDLGCEAQPVSGTVTPYYSVSANVVTPGTQITFDPLASTTDAGNSITTATWSFGDGSAGFAIGAPAETTHSYATAATYTVTLTLVDSHGNVASISHTIRVATPPTPAIAFTPGIGVAGFPVAFSGAASSEPNAGATLSSYQWTFGDGSSGTGATQEHTYAAPGVYTVTLKVTDSLGLTAQTTRSIGVAAPGRITAVALKRVKTARYLIVTVSGPGVVAVGARSSSTATPGTVSIKLALSDAQRRRLAHRQRVSERLRIVYTPRYGPQIVRIQAITIKP